MRNSGIDWDLVLTVTVAILVTVGVVILIGAGPSLDEIVFWEAR